jgi:hypothetical protein
MTRIRCSFGDEQARLERWHGLFQTAGVVAGEPW